MTFVLWVGLALLRTLFASGSYDLHKKSNRPNVTAFKPMFDDGSEDDRSLAKFGQMLTAVFPPLPPGFSGQQPGNASQVHAGVPVPVHALDREMSAKINSDWESLLAVSVAGNQRSLKFPWEVGFAATVLGKDAGPSWENHAMSVIKKFNAFQPDPTSVPTSQASTDIPQETKRLTAAKSMWPVVAMRLQGIAWDCSECAVREVALKKWKLLIHRCPESCGLGRRLIQQMFELREDGF